MCACESGCVCASRVLFCARFCLFDLFELCVFCARLLLWFSCLRSFFVDSHSLICVTVVSEEIMAVNLTGDSDEVRG